MKTAVSIPDELFEQAEKLAAERKLSRSALYAEALRALVERARDDAITAELNRCIAEDGGAVKADPAFTRRMRRELERNGGQW